MLNCSAVLAAHPKQVELLFSGSSICSPLLTTMLDRATFGKKVACSSDKSLPVMLYLSDPTFLLSSTIKGSGFC